MRISKQEAIYATVVYASIFQYPLTLKEISYWIIGVSPISLRYEKACIVRDGRLTIRLPFITLKGKTHLIRMRQLREYASLIKWRKAKIVANLLRIIPTIRLVGVTGGLSMNNTIEDDDIDFFIITAPHTLWVTRSLATLLLDVFFLRRKPTSTSFRNAICLNMFMCEDAMSLKKNERDLYSAHEVLQMTPLWVRGSTYVRFLLANKWTKLILPNAWDGSLEKAKTFSIKKYQFPIIHKILTMIVTYVSVLLQLIEPITKYLQLLYMRKRRTSEIVTDTYIRFHPHDYRMQVKKALAQSLRRSYIPLDNLWFYSLK